MTVVESRANAVSSFTIIKGSLIDETYAAFEAWVFEDSKLENLRRMQEENTIGASSENWLRDVRKVLNRRFDPEGRDRPLVELAKARCDRDTWRPILLWHITRDEFLVRDFLVEWLYPRFRQGAYQVRPEELVPYLKDLPNRTDIELAGSWTTNTLDRVASGLIRIAADFGLLAGSSAKAFAPFHLPDDSFLYVLHAISDAQLNPVDVIHSADWHLFLLDSGDVERELLRLHQFHRVQYEAAGSLVRLTLPSESAPAFARKLAT